MTTIKDFKMDTLIFNIQSASAKDLHYSARYLVNWGLC